MNIISIILLSVFFVTIINTIVILGILIKKYITVSKYKKDFLFFIILVSLWLIFILMNSFSFFVNLEFIDFFNIVMLLLIIGELVIFEEAKSVLLESFYFFVLIVLAIFLGITVLLDWKIIMVVLLLVTMILGLFRVVRFLVKISGVENE